MVWYGVRYKGTMGRVQVYSGCGTEARVVRCKGTGSTTGGTIQEHGWYQTCTPPYPQARTPQKNTRTANFGKLVVLYLICLCFFFGVRVWYHPCSYHPYPCTVATVLLYSINRTIALYHPYPCALLHIPLYCTTRASLPYPLLTYPPTHGFSA